MPVSYHLYCPFSACWPIFLTLFFSPENSSVFSLRDGFFFFFFSRMAQVWQLGEVRLSMTCAACCHVALVLAVRHLRSVFLNFVLLLSIPYHTFGGDMVLIK